MKKISWMCAFSCLGFSAWTCGVDNPVSHKIIGLRMNDSGATPAGINAVVQANNQFALDVYAELRSGEGNVFLSPYSISTALAMTYEGARGQTAEEIVRVFHFPTGDVARHAAFAAIHNQLNQEDAAYELNIANALWAQKDYAFLEAYINTLQSYYAATATNLDFAGATEGARKTINAWVEVHTNHKIKDLFPEGSLSALTRLVLTNAVYFKGQWVTQFDKGQTKDAAFYISPNNAVTVSFMRLRGDGVRFNYAQDEGVQVLEMPYKGEKLTMTLFLPTNGDLAEFENVFSLEKLEGWKNRLQMQRVDVFLPRFKFETKYFMSETLKKMGMPTAFSSTANFSGMDGTRSLAIQTVIHQAFVDVNEEGTEAAAATGVAVAERSARPPVPVFRADRPFLFLIQDIEHGNILFLGRVADPRG